MLALQPVGALSGDRWKSPPLEQWLQQQTWSFYSNVNTWAWALCHPAGTRGQVKRFDMRYCHGLFLFLRVALQRCS